MLANLWHSIMQLGLGILLAIIVAYVIYAVGLSLVFRRLGVRAWPAFVPGYNYITLIRALGLPKSWQATAFIPYVGQIYAVAVGVRLGKIFGKDAVFSSFWLTLGAPIGMPLIAFSKVEPDLTVIKEPVPQIDTKKIQATLRGAKNRAKNKIKL